MQLCREDRWAGSVKCRLAKKFEVVVVAREVLNALIRSMSEHRENRETTIDSSEASAVAVVEPLLLAMRDAARVLGIGRSTLYELIAAGEIEVVHIGRSARVPVAALHEFVERCRTSGLR